MPENDETAELFENLEQCDRMIGWLSRRLANANEIAEQQPELTPIDTTEEQAQLANVQRLRREFINLIDRKLVAK